MTKRSLSILVLAVFLALVVVQALAASPQGTRPDPTAVAWQRGIQATATTEDYTQRIQATATAEANYVSYHPTHTAATTDDSLIVRVIAEIRTNLLLYGFIFTVYILTYLCLTSKGHTPDHTPTEEA